MARLGDTRTGRCGGAFYNPWQCREVRAHRHGTARLCTQGLAPLRGGGRRMPQGGYSPRLKKPAAPCVGPRCTYCCWPLAVAWQSAAVCGSVKAARPLGLRRPRRGDSARAAGGSVKAARPLGLPRHRPGPAQPPSAGARGGIRPGRCSRRRHARIAGRVLHGPAAAGASNRRPCGFL